MPPTEARQDHHYQRIRRGIEMRIRRGALSPGERIPGEREIAREAGVSQMTVNRAIQELVRSGWLVRRVGAGTFVCGADQRPSEEQTLVLVVPFTAHPEEDVYLRSPFQAIRQGAAAQDCALVVSEAPEGSFAQIVDRHPHAAFIFAAPNEEGHSALCGLHEQGVPFVVMGASWPDAPYPCLDSDNAGGARTAVEYLLRLGHDRIAFVNGLENAPNCRDRLSGYQKALCDHGLRVDTELVISAGSNWELSDGARSALTNLLLRPRPVTAILCAGYYIALGVYSLLQNLSLRIPEDASIVGFDDPRSAAHLNPPLTTIRQPLVELGERALARALSLLDCPADGSAPVDYLPVQLVVRDSCRRHP